MSAPKPTAHLHYRKPLTTGDQARYTRAFLRSTGSFTDTDGTNGYAEVIAISVKSWATLVTLRWPNGIERTVNKANLQRRRS